MAEQIANFGHTTLNEALDASETTITVTDGSVFPSSGDFRVRVDDEIMLVTARSTNDLTVTRGAESTSAVTHSDGADIDARLTAGGILSMIQENGVSSGVVGASAYPTSDQVSLTASIYNKVVLGASDFDTDGFFDNANDRFEIPAGLGGSYLLWGNVYATGVGSATSNFQLQYKVNDTGIYDTLLYRGEKEASEDWTRSFARVVQLDAGDTIDIGIAPGTVGNWDVFASGTIWGIYKLGSGTAAEAIGAKAYHSTTQGSLAAGVNPLDMNTEDRDSDGFHDTSTNPSRFTIPAGLGGKYRLIGRALVDTAYSLYWRVDGATLLGGTGQHVTGTVNEVVQEVELAAGQYVELCEYHGSGTATAGDASSRHVQTEAAITLLATSGADPGRVRVATSFPTPGDAWVDNVVRSDLDGICFTHDGTRWVSAELYTMPLSIRSGGLMSAGSADPIRFANNPVHYSLGMWFERVDWTSHCTGTLDGSNYYTIAFKNTAEDTTYLSFDNSGDTASTWTKHEWTTGAEVPTTAIGLMVMADETGSTGVLSIGITAYYRLIAT